MIDYPALLPFCKTTRQTALIEAVIQHGSHGKAAKALKLSRQTIDQGVKRVKREAERRGALGEMKEQGIVPTGFIAETSVKRRFNPETETMEVVEDWTKSKLDKGMDLAMHEALLAGLAQELPRAKKTKAPKKLNDLLASAIIFGDAHLGMLAHGIETHDEDYNLEKATADIRAAIDYCVDCAPASEQGWFINVGDFTHANDSKNMTPESGNIMDVSARHQQVMRAAGATIRYCIDKMLTKFGKVTVINARGNHDKDAAFGLNMYIEGIYEAEPRVEVQGNDSKFNFIEFGNCLIGVNHGDKINEQRLAGVMTKFQAEAWGRTRFRRWWIGHVHHKNRKETDFGVTIESFHTLAALDEWHAGSGYGAERRVTMITLHKEFGEVHRMEPSLEMVRAFAA